MTDQSDSSTPVKDRVVRVFISSTFKDMHAEREELVKFIFPELKRRCRERLVEFVDVDLRWGITDEQKAEGKVLPICLAEIDRCRPYFVGLLGERYGWIPGKIERELIKNHPWLLENKYKGHSVTALEIYHGVLKDPAMRCLAYFYFRDPQTSQEIEKELAKNLNYLPEPEVSRIMLQSLKEQIRQSGYSIRENYIDAKNFGQMVLEDLWQAIDKRFPLPEVPTFLEQERLGHEAYAAARRKVYIGRKSYFRKIDDHVAGNGVPLVLLGESGSGKSTLIANWVERYREKHPDDFVIMHFIGGTVYSADYTRIITRIMEEIKERYEPEKKDETKILSVIGNGVAEEIPADPVKLIEQFPFWLAKTTGKGRLILILDALNQLEDKDNAPDLGWLPIYFPPHIRVIVSTVSGRSLEALEKRNWLTLTIKPLTLKEKDKFITHYLKQYVKKLSPSLIKRITQAQQTLNPLFLKSLLEELRIYGDHFTLEQRINYYLSAESTKDLYEKILVRWEQDYEREKKGLVQEVMSLLWASRRGLSEVELLEILGSDGVPFPRAYWSPLFLAAEESLFSRSGLLDFFHDFIRRAVQDRYLNDAVIEQSIRYRLINYFKNSSLDRKLDEYPYQLRHTEQWQSLAKVLSDLDFFHYAWDHKQKFEWIGYWIWIRDCSNFYRYAKISMGEKDWQLSVESCEPNLNYKNAIGAREKKEESSHVIVQLLLRIADFLGHMGLNIDASYFLERAVVISEINLLQEHPDDVIYSLNNLAVLYDTQRWFHLAKPIYKRALAIAKKAYKNDHQHMAVADILGNLAAHYMFRGKLIKAEHHSKRALEIKKKLFGTDSEYVRIDLKILADIYYYQNKYKNAEPLYKEGLRLAEKFLGSEHPSVASLLNNLGTNYTAQGQYEEASSLFERAVRISIGSFGPDHPQTELYKINMDNCMEMRGNRIKKIDLPRLPRIKMKSSKDQLLTYKEIFHDLRLRWKNNQNR